MIHIRIDDSPLNADRKFGFGIGPELPPGDTYYFDHEWRAERADCPGCNPAGPRPLGVPISQLSGRADPGNPGWENFKRLASSWGYD